MAQQQQQQQQSNQNYMIKGILQMEGEYIIVNLEIQCCWKTSSSSQKKSGDGQLTYYCRVQSATFIRDNVEEDKTKQKIRTKMISRLQQDTYIMKLLSVEGENDNDNDKNNDDDDNDDDSSSSFLYLANAKIEVEESNNILEERVDVSDVVAEALRRAIWSSSDSSIDIIELILGLPSLPTTSHGNIKQQQQQ